MIKKVIKLTESDLVKIVKRVIEEQITDKGQIVPKTIKIPDNNPKGFPFKAGTEVKTDDFISILKKSPVGVNAFHIKSDGWEFPIHIWHLLGLWKLQESLLFVSQEHQSMARWFCLLLCQEQLRFTLQCSEGMEY